MINEEINMENLFPGTDSNLNALYWINKFINETNLKTFTISDVKKGIIKNIPINTIQSNISGLYANKALERVSNGIYKKTSVDLESISCKDIKTVPNDRWCDKNGPNKIYITDLQYEKVAKYLQGDTLILCGPNAKLRIRQSRPITGTKHNLYLIDNNRSIFKLIIDEIPDKSKRIIKPILCNVGDINHNVIFQDLDFCSTWAHKDNSKREAGEIAANRLIQQLNCKYPVAAMNITFALRPFKKIRAVRFINSLLHVLGASIKSFDNCVDGYGNGTPVIINPKIGFGFTHKPNWLNKGRVLELDFYSYSDTKTQMITCLIIYNGGC